jgi:hypothetical protein
METWVLGIPLNKKMENIRTIAVIGFWRKKFFTQRIIRALPPLLFDNNKEALTNIHESLMAQNRHGDIEKMDCALSASWEADIIILLVLCNSWCSWKNKGGCYSKNYNYYGKWWWFSKSINRQVSFDLIFLILKMYKCINVMITKEFLKFRSKFKALDTVAGISIDGFTTFLSSLNVVKSYL